MTNKQQLEALDVEIKAKLKDLAGRKQIIHDPIIDGVIDVERYLSCKPKILWILKEPWEKLGVGEAGGDWSVPAYLKNGGKISDKGTWANMAYVAYSIFNDFVQWDEIDYVSKNSEVANALRNIAYINVSKFPGKSRSVPAQIAASYQINKEILSKQISIIRPDIVIGGSTLGLFFASFGLKPKEFISAGSLKFCVRDNRLYIDAYHPGQWASLKPSDYVNEIVVVIKNHSPVSPTRQQAT